MLMKKKQLLMATLVIALGAAVAVNWYYTKNPLEVTPESTTVNEQVSGILGESLSVGSSAVSEDAAQPAQSVMANADFFTRERLKREETYDEIIEAIEDMAEKENISQQEEEKITALLANYTKSMKVQSDTESLISAKTGSDCVVVINGEACQIIMEKNSLNDTVILQITEIIEKNTNISAKNLTIFEAK